MEENISPLVVIEIRGLANTGKTTLALAIKEMLVAHGIVNVAVCDVDVAYNRTNLSLQDRRLAALAEKGTNVIIETSQVVRF